MLLYTDDVFNVSWSADWIPVSVVISSIVCVCDIRGL